MFTTTCLCGELRPRLATQIGHQSLNGTCVALCAILAASVGGSGLRSILAKYQVARSRNWNRLETAKRMLADCLEMVDMTFFGQYTNLLDQSPSEQELVTDVWLPFPDFAEIVALKARLAGVEGERDAAVRSQSNKRAATMSSVASHLCIRWGQAHAQEKVCWKLSEWLQSEELGEAFVVGNENRVMELSSRLSGGAARLSELMGVMVL